MRSDGVVGKIKQQEWLKPAEESLQELIHKAFGFRGGRRVKNFSVGHGSDTLYTRFSPTS
jgi:hypothetical protein